MNRKHLFVLVNIAAAFLFVSDRIQAAEQETLSLLRQETSSSRVVGNIFREFRMKPEIKTPVDKFFAAHAKDFNLRDFDVLVPAQTIPDNLIKEQPRVVTHFQQLYKNIPVMGAGYILHADPQGDVLAGTGKLVPGITVDTTPTITEAAALAAAKKAVTAEVYSTTIPKGTLVIAFKDLKKMSAESARLAWRFDVVSEKPSQSYRVTIVAVGPDQGTVLQKIDNRMYVIPGLDGTVNRAGYCQMTDVDGVMEPLTPISSPSTQFVCNRAGDGKLRLMCFDDNLSCTSSIQMIDQRIINGKNPQSQLSGDVSDYVFEDDGKQDPPVFGAEGEEEDRVGDDLYWGLENAAHYFNAISGGWSGFDGGGKTTIMGSAKDLGSKVAFYDSTSKYIDFNPDLTAVVDPSTNRWDSKRTMEICGHEFAHGILDATHPTLVNQGETAALNEGFAYIFGYLVYYYDLSPELRPPFGSDWESGTDLKTFLESGGYPTTYKGLYYLGNEGCGNAPGCYQTPGGMFTCNQIYTGTDDIPPGADQCNAERRNSTVQQYMFYLLANGGSGTNDNHDDYSVTGIGSEDASHIAFETMTGWLLPSSSYSDARWAWMAAADFLYKGQADHDAIVKSVQDAWSAVGGVTGEEDDSSVTPGDGATDVPPWPANFGWKSTKADGAGWQVQVDTSPKFDSQDLQTSQQNEIVTHGAMSPSSPALPNRGGQSPTGFQDTKGTSSGPLLSRPGDIAAGAGWQHYLKPETFYYWRVRSKRVSSAGSLQMEPISSDGWGDWSQTHYFKTGVIETKLISPGGMAKAYPWQAEFKWEPVAGATLYCVQPSENPKVVADCPAPSSPSAPGEITTKSFGEKTFGTPLLKQGAQTIGNWLLKQGPGYGAQTIGKWLTDDGENPNVASKIPNGVSKAPIPTAQNIADEASSIVLPLPGELVGPNTSTTYSYPLKVDHAYYWAVLPYHEDIQGTWSNGGQGQPFETSKPKGVLESPMNGASVSPWNIQLKWKKTVGAAGYHLYMAQDSTNSPLADPTIKGGDVLSTTMKDLNLEGLSSDSNGRISVYWTETPIGPSLSRVASESSEGEEGAPSDPGNFFIDPNMTKPTLHSPADGSWYDYKLQSHPSGVAFQWTPVAKAKIYKVFFYPKNSDGSCGTQSFMGVAQNNPKARDSSGNYVELTIQHFTDDYNYDRCWRVQAIGPNNEEGELSEPHTIVVGPDLPVNLNPANGATNISYPKATISWTSQWAPEGYKVSFYDANLKPIVTFPSSGTSYEVATAPGFHYFWEVQACKNGMCMTSARQDFTTKSPCDNTILPSVPVGVSPCPGKDSAGDCTNVPQSVTFSWPAVAGAKSYILSVDPYGTGEPIQTIPVSGTTLPHVLPYFGGGYVYEYIVYLQPVNSCGAPTPLKNASGGDNVPGTIFTTVQQ